MDLSKISQEATIPLQRALVVVNNVGNLFILDSEGIDFADKRRVIGDFWTHVGDLDISHPSAQEEHFKSGFYVWEGKVYSRNYDTLDWRGKWRTASQSEIDCWQYTGELFPQLNTAEDGLEYFGGKGKLPNLISFAKDLFKVTPVVTLEKDFPIKVVFTVTIPYQDDVIDLQCEWNDKRDRELGVKPIDLMRGFCLIDVIFEDKL